MTAAKAEELAQPAAAVSAAAALEVVDDPLEQGQFTRMVAGAGGVRLAESSLQLSGMHCAACSGIIERALMGVPGVRGARVSAAAERATVTWDPAATKPSLLIAAVRGAGYDAVPDAAAPARALRQAEHRQALWRLFVASFCAMQVMMFATPSYVADAGTLAPDLRQLLNWGSWLLSLPVLLFSAGPFFSGAWRSLRQRRIGMDVPVALGVAITFVASSGAAFDPGGAFGDEVWFDSLTMFVSFLLAARYLELRARQRAAAALEGALARLPETAWRVAADGSTEAVSPQRLQPGDLVRVPVGQAFAADGLLEQGATRADEALLSGESAPVEKAVGDELVAGSLNLGAPVLLRVKRVGGDTRVQAIVEMMRGALSQRPAAARLADRWAGPFLWGVLLLAGLAALYWHFVDPSRALPVAVAVLIVTCPCALSLAAPAALVAAARGLARRGVLVQRLDAIETLAGATQFFFDKTGTLTEDRPQWRQTRLTEAGSPGWEAAGERDALATAALLAAWSTHPLSRALVAAAAVKTPGQGWSAPAERSGLGWSGFEEVAGQGVQALDGEGCRWRLGSAAWVDAAATGEGQVWLGCNGRARAAFVFDETLRPGTIAALQALRAEGLRVTLLTGDALPRAQALAARVGFDEIVAAATPETKLAAVAAAQAAGERVVMVGDGINDAPVLARADASLAMGQGALVARSQADAVVTSNDLADVVRARRSARKAVAIVRQNIAWALVYNALAIPMAVAGWLPPWAAGLGMALSSLAVVFNALRAAR
ncbi:Type cbb3 cytochrome oxidase biogenesis protein CcoI; Copper-translocating P-type ATPase [Rubrivivax sp. A210]|uniref:heavy metal translocating P-type ATPase n=1 Tax=Rubrivivax sp. A210 TaxID=2772301 RepID=UPI001919DFB2|nr:cation-translocating P-type ATPase [Rubrivivax sp. A210]CAD5365879.1 Type cbb3 cytochrome oxidase biogenesis protein CcoI; Copper-translocating P-type ATPase [Rubrivivax sp. A210]